MKQKKTTSADIKFLSYPIGDTSKKEYFERRMAARVVRRIARKLRERYGTLSSIMTDTEEFSNDMSRSGTIGTIHAPSGLLNAIASDASILYYKIFSIKIRPNEQN